MNLVVPTRHISKRSVGKFQVELFGLKSRHGESLEAARRMDRFWMKPNDYYDC